MKKTETNATYHSSSAISKSMLENMAVCPFYYKWKLENKEEPTTAMIFGSAFHKFVLEKDTFYDEFAVLPKLSKAKKEDKAIYEEFMMANEGKTIIQQADFDKIVEMAKMLENDNLPSPLLQGTHEESIYFTDEKTGLELKIRPDNYIVAEDGDILIADIKTCASLKQNFDCEKAVEKYGYDLQAYMYSLGLSIEYGISIDRITFVFIFIEKEPPYMPETCVLESEFYKKAEQRFREYLDTVKYCTDNNNWYGLNGPENTIKLLRMPKWASKNDKGDEE